MRKKHSKPISNRAQNSTFWVLIRDLHQEISLVTQRDEVIGKLREQASVQWASGWLAFQKKATNAYLGLDFNFDIPSDEEEEESFSANYSQEPGTPAEADSPSSPFVPPADA